MRYDIHNPTKAGRVIYDGVDGQQRKITVLPGETKHGVELAEHIAAGFNFAPCTDKSDLVLTPLNEQPPWEDVQPQALPSDYVRYRAPPIENAALELCADPAVLLSADRPKRGRPVKSKTPLPIGE